jgi:uncharacterized protein with PQ loop repeat
VFIKTNKKQKKEILEIALVVAVVQPLTVLPQIAHIFQQHSAKDVSLLTWVLLLIFNTLNFIYASVFKIKPFIINNAVWIVVDAMVVTGVFMYR